MLRSRWRNGNGRDGFITKILEDGSSGTVDIIWGVGAQMTKDRLGAGGRFVATSRRLKIIVGEGTRRAGPASAKQSFIGPMILEKYKRTVDKLTDQKPQ